MNPSQPPSGVSTLELSLERGRLGLKAQAIWAGEDLMVLITGGDRPHLGAVAAATPRASLSDPERNSATASVLTYVGHKEDGPAKHIAEALAAALNTKVIVAAGMHWEDVTQAELDHIANLLTELQQKLLAELQPISV